MSKIYDISLTMQQGMVVWPGDPDVKMERISKIENGDACNVTFLCTTVHAGTHVDAPYHFLTNGATIETLPLDALIGTAQVVQIPDDVKLIDRMVLEQVEIQTGIKRILFKTRNVRIRAFDQPKFDPTFVAISADAAELLVDKDIRLVGVDYLSVAPFDNSRLTHEILLGAKVILLEGIILDAVEPGLYTLYCLPLKLAGSDGAPARTILVKD